MITFVGFSRRYITETFVDLYPVASMRGVYVASQLSRGKPGTRKIYTRISYDKGRAWDKVTVPETHANGSAINCPPVRSFAITRIKHKSMLEFLVVTKSTKAKFTIFGGTFLVNDMI